MSLSLDWNVVILLTIIRDLMRAGFLKMWGNVLLTSGFHCRSSMNYMVIQSLSPILNILNFQIAIEA